MNITLYNNSSPKIQIGKNLTVVKSMTGELREECDMINPSILIENAGVISANYAYIPEFGRYYFITKITSVRKDLWRVDMHVDVRETYKNQIKANTAVVARSSGYYNLYLPDSKMPLTQDNFNITYTLGSQFDNAGVFLLASDSREYAVTGESESNGGGGGHDF